MLVSFFLACCPNDEHFATLRWCKRAYKCCKPPKAHEGWVARESFGRNCVALLRLKMIYLEPFRMLQLSDLFWLKVSRDIRSCSHLTGMQQASLTLSIWSLKQLSEWAKSSNPRRAEMYLWRVESGQRSRSQYEIMAFDGSFSDTWRKWFFSTTRRFIYLETLHLTRN